jgi:hypothetical protein
MPLPSGWLPDLTARFTALAGAAHSDTDAAAILTAEYAEACGHLIHIFELLGPLLAVARSDLDAKVAALRAAASAPGGATLGSLLARDLVGGSICRSCDARHAHRLLLVVRFVQLLVARLAADAAASPSAAAGRRLHRVAGAHPPLGAAHRGAGRHAAGAARPGALSGGDGRDRGVGSRTRAGLCGRRSARQRRADGTAGVTAAGGHAAVALLVGVSALAA